MYDNTSHILKLSNVVWMKLPLNYDRFGLVEEFRIHRAFSGLEGVFNIPEFQVYFLSRHIDSLLRRI